MDDFNISFMFIDNMDDALARAERRWNGTTVFVSRSKFNELSDSNKKLIILHECCHAIHQQLHD